MTVYGKSYLQYPGMIFHGHEIGAGEANIIGSWLMNACRGMHACLANVSAREFDRLRYRKEIHQFIRAHTEGESAQLTEIDSRRRSPAG